MTTLLLDADDTLFPSEAPAFEASAHVVNALLAELGSEQRYAPEELRLATTGSNFRTTAGRLAARACRKLTPDDLDRWVAAELAAVTEHLATVLWPDPEVVDTLTRLSRTHELAVVTSSALSRLDACLQATGLDGRFAPERRFSAESSLPRPTSKPDPAIYRHACERLNIGPEDALAVEDSPTGASSAVAAGIRTLGIVRFVVPAEREERVAALEAAGVAAVLRTWRELEAHLSDDGSAAIPRSHSVARALR